MKSLLIGFMVLVFSIRSYGQNYQINPIIKEKLPEYIKSLPKRIYKKCLYNQSICFIDTNAYDTLLYIEEHSNSSIQHNKNYFKYNLEGQSFLISDKQISFISDLNKLKWYGVRYKIIEEEGVQWLCFTILQLKRIRLVQVGENAFEIKYKGRLRFTEKYRMN